MNGADRVRLKQLIDEQRRKQLQAAHLRLCCAGCGCHIDGYSVGCATCRGRRKSRGKRARERRMRKVAA